MTLRKVLKILAGLLISFAVAVGFISIDHPIILKWVTGTARHHGSAMPAIVYTNGKVNEHVKVFYTDDPNSYLLSLAEYDSSGVLKFLNINLAEKWIGRPAVTSKNDYDLIGGHLFQSEAGGHFTPIQRGLTGFTFDPAIAFKGRQIKFLLPLSQSKLDSVRIELP
jgi:hypothetical protein